MRLTHEAQVMPSIGQLDLGRGRGRRSRSYSQGVYQPRPGTPAAARGTLAAMPAARIAVLTLAGPLGPFVVAATERGVVAADWASSEEGLLDAPPPAPGRGRDRDATDRRRTAGTPPGPSSRRCLPASPRIRRRSRSTSQDRPRFDRLVLGAVRTLAGARPPATARSPGSVGVPRARHARSAAHSAAIPISLVIPCHRVIASDGTLGGYGGDGWIGPRPPARPKAGPAPAGRRHGRPPPATRIPLGPAVGPRPSPRVARSGGAPLTRRRWRSDERSERTCPVDVRGVPSPRLFRSLAGAADLDRGLITDRPGCRDLRLSRHGVRPRGRPHADGHGHPEPDHRPAGRASSSIATTGNAS